MYSRIPYTYGGFDASSNSSNISPWRLSNIYGGDDITSVSFPGLRGEQTKKKLEWTGELITPPAFFPSAGVEIAQLELPTELGKTYQLDFDYVSSNEPTNVVPTRIINFGPSSWIDDRRLNQTAEQAATVKHFRSQVTIITRSQSIVSFTFLTTQSNNKTKRVYVALDNVQLREVL